MPSLYLQGRFYLYLMQLCRIVFVIHSVAMLVLVYIITVIYLARI